MDFGALARRRSTHKSISPVLMITPTRRALSQSYGPFALSMILRSTIECPQCGYRSEETMPTDACQFFYDCKGCSGRLKPKPGDCCVFCSYGSVPCPPMQSGGGCGQTAGGT